MHHRQMLSKALLTSLVGFAELRDVPVVQTFIANARAEAYSPFFLWRRLFESVARRQLVRRAALGAAIRRRRRPAAFTR